MALHGASDLDSDPEPSQQVRGILAFLADDDCASLAGHQPAALVGSRVVMQEGGRLLLAGAHGRPVRPLLFLGRSPDGHLAYLCTPLEPAADTAS